VEIYARVTKGSFNNSIKKGQQKDSPEKRGEGALKMTEDVYPLLMIVRESSEKKSGEVREKRYLTTRQNPDLQS